MALKARIAGWACSELGTKLHKPPSVLVKQALSRALQHAGMQLEQLDGFLSCPSLADQRFMWAHHLATEVTLRLFNARVLASHRMTPSGPLGWSRARAMGWRYYMQLHVTTLCATPYL